MDNREKQSRKNPMQTSNFLSVLFFGWTVPIFWKGAKRDLNLTDLYDPLESDESELLGDRLEREWKKELVQANQEGLLGEDEKQKPGSQPNLLWAITRMFWAPYMVQGLLLLVQTTVLHLARPILQGLVISYFDSCENLMTRNQVLLYAGLLIIDTLAISFITQHTILRIRQTGMCIRVACCSMIYRKVLRLNQAAVNNTAAGQVANLISNDVARFDEVPMHLHYFWIMPIQVMLMGYIMWQSVGAVALVGIGTMIMQTLPIQGYLSNVSSKLRSKIAVKTDERVQLMSELLSGIQVVKMYSWEKPFELMVSEIRALEMKFISYTAYLRGFQISFLGFSEKVGLYFTLITFVLLGNTLTAKTTFVLASLFALLQKTCNYHFPRAIIAAGEASVSLERITKFLLLEEVERTENVNPAPKNELWNVEETNTGQQIGDQVGIDIIKITANWVHDHLPPTLSEVSMKIRSQSLCALVGPVGSGKSSLLHVILGDLSVQTGHLSLCTNKSGKTRITDRDIRISYASQDPWLFSATIRDNILFGQPYDERRYQEVTRVCALLQDFGQLPQGDLSFVGERGTALSGGQRARVNLARAVYRDADLYLLDDPLSAVDTRVGRHLFEECITGFLKNKTRILVTHQLQYLRQSDTVIVFNRGTVECQGTYDELVKTNVKVFVSDESEEPDKVEYTEENHEQNPECKIAPILGGNNDQQWKVPESSEGLKEIGEEEKATGYIPSKVYWDYFMAGGNMGSLALLAIVFIAGQIAASGTDYWLTYWIKLETPRGTSQLNKLVDHNSSYRNNTEGDHREIYFTKSQWFYENGLLYRNLGIYIYTVCLSGCILFMILRSMLFARMCVNASRNIHDSILGNLLRATVRFFDMCPCGRILNRLTKDMGAMDELLPRAMMETLQVFIQVIAILIIVILANYWMILPAVPICGLFYILRNYYLKAAQAIKRLEGITKSPMFSHTISTLDGLTTIRSRGALAKDLLRREFDRHQDAHTGAWYLAIATAAAFGFTLDIISCCFIACICFSFILMDSEDTLAGFVGLAISQSLVLTGMLQYGIRQSTEVISQMTAVERILQYTKLPREGPFTTENPPPSTWPPKGRLIFKDVSMRYANHKPPVLKNLNLTINAGWKIGVVGRTGAGKSSLISALFRLTGDGLDGKIVLDGTDTKSIGLHELRPRISIIPQGPILFSASLRQNLDPLKQYSDAELWDSLREVELGNVVPSLDFQVAEGGANLSLGQRQLICLARAILRNNRLLVLDEATANVDHGTDALIQNAIRRRFADCTVITIAHRLNTIMDSDRVLVMREGCAVEFGHPHLLLKDRGGHFFQMVQQTGKATAEKLTGMAESAFFLSPEFRKEPNELPSPSETDYITHL